MLLIRNYEILNNSHLKEKVDERVDARLQELLQVRPTSGDLSRFSMIINDYF